MQRSTGKASEETYPAFPWFVELMEGDEVYDTIIIRSTSGELKFKEAHRAATFTGIRISTSDGDLWRAVPLEEKLIVGSGATPVITLKNTLTPPMPDGRDDTMDTSHSLTFEERDFLHRVLSQFPFEYRRRALVDSILRKLDRL